MRKIPITLMTGFLESGKTTTIMRILKSSFAELEGTTLIVNVEEEGEAVYDDDFLRNHNIVLVEDDNPGNLTREFFQELQDAYCPDRVFIEYNGMLKVSYFEKLKLPVGWKIERQMTLVDASCFFIYMKNLKDRFLDMVRHADLVLFNRCNEATDCRQCEAIVREVNSGADIFFQKEKE